MFNHQRREQGTWERKRHIHVIGGFSIESCLSALVVGKQDFEDFLAASQGVVKMTQTPPPFLEMRLWVAPNDP